MPHYVVTVLIVLAWIAGVVGGLAVVGGLFYLNEKAKLAEAGFTFASAARYIENREAERAEEEANGICGCQDYVVDKTRVTDGKYDLICICGRPSFAHSDRVVMDSVRRHAIARQAR